MIQETLSKVEPQPNSEGIFCYYGVKKQLLYIAPARNFNDRIDEAQLNKILNTVELKIADVKFIKSKNRNLIKLYTEKIRRKKPFYNISIAEEKHYPHLKFTPENFPRPLVTRKIESDEAEYFGAFLSETGVRFLFDFLNRTFRLRNCTIPIDGSFLSPCTQFYEKKCVAPCVAAICEKSLYDEFVNLARLFLQNKRKNLENSLLKKIESAAQILDFEAATEWRDMLLNVRDIWENKNLQVWLDDAVDSFEVEEKNQKIFIYLVTQRGRKILGRKTFLFEATQNSNAQFILSEVLWQFYRHHAPKEIRVATDFPNRKFLAEVLSERENRIIKINIVKPDNKKKITERAFARSKFEFDLQQIAPPVDYKKLQAELKRELKLKYLPERIECFDVAHISGTDFVAAKSVWERGKLLVDEYKYWFFEEQSELKMIEKAVEANFQNNDQLPDLILIDGGKSQLNAALQGLKAITQKRFSVLSAVKPPHFHNQISHFISDTGKIFSMKSESAAMQILVRLRDAAHDLANRMHRIQRDTSHFYELAIVLPFLNEKERNFLLQKFGSINKIKQAEMENLIELIGIEKGEKTFFEIKRLRGKSSGKIKSFIVPIRFDDPNGEAEDLQPFNKR